MKFFGRKNKEEREQIGESQKRAELHRAIVSTFANLEETYAEFKDTDQKRSSLEHGFQGDGRSLKLYNLRLEDYLEGRNKIFVKWSQLEENSMCSMLKHGDVETQIANLQTSCFISLMISLLA